jgi:hypothetical protein
MNCYVSGLLGLGMVMASLSTMTISKRESNKFKKVLSPKLKLIYDRISSERKKNYLHGLILGLIIATIIFKFKFLKISNKYHQMSTYLAITLVVTIFYYTLSPKSDYMLKHLKTPTENKAWLQIYKVMKNRYIVGFILGSLSSLPFSYVLC